MFLYILWDKSYFYLPLDEANSRNMSRKLFSFLENSDISIHFKQFKLIDANRMIKERISMIHIASGIQCILLLENDESIIESSDIIKQFIDKEPLCK